jgi:hypothetical protein
MKEMMDWDQGEIKNSSRRRKEADFGAKTVSASSPRRLRLLQRFLNALWDRGDDVLGCWRASFPMRHHPITPSTRFFR